MHIFVNNFQKDMSEQAIQDVVRSLLKRGVNVTAKDNKNKSVLHYACEMKEFKLVKYLMTNFSFDCNEVDRDGISAFFYYLRQEMNNEF
jgi:ankyrin repeat protein